MTSGALAIDVTKRLRDVTLRVDLKLGPGVTALVGPSGAGKTTVLRLVAGLMHPDTGTIRLGETLLDDAASGYHLAPGRRAISLVFQEYALFPHLSVAENVAYGLRARHVGRAERRRRVGTMLERLGLDALAGERPGRLSGGQRQRVALARALVLEPRALLLDEPLAALDVQTRAAVRSELRAMLAGLSVPVVLVTHDYADALVFRERIVIMDGGQIVQDGSHDALLAHPRSRFVAAFTGINYYEGYLDDHPQHAESGVERVRRVRLDGGVAVYVLAEEIAAGPVGLALRPWEIVLSTARPAGSAQNVLRGRVREVLPLGGRVRVVLAVAMEPADPAATDDRASAGQEAPLPLVAEITHEAHVGLDIHEGQPLYASFKATAITIGAL